MFQNYLKLAWRNLLANKLASGINILGLSIAIGVCITVYLFLENHYTMDNFHQHGDRIFMVEYVLENQGSEEVWGNSPLPLGPALAEKFPQVERTVRVEMEGVKAYSGESVFDELMSFADPGYFDMFSFPLEFGDPAALATPNSLILSHDAAAKFFPGENAMGKLLTVGFGLREKKAFTVGGVAAKFPENTGFGFSLLTGFDALTTLGLAKTDNWATMTNGTFVQLKPGADIAVLEKNMAQFVKLHNAADPELKLKSFVFDNLKNPNPKAHEVIRRPTEAPQPVVLLVFGGLALLMFALSCFNYINISLGQSARRLKEIGVRKVVGGTKRQLVWQFLTENMLLCFIALLLGLAFTQAVLIPFFNDIIVEKISLSLRDLGIWLFLAGLLAFTGLASGAYPALYISSFQTVSIFRGKSTFTSKSKLAKAFLYLQFVLAFGTVISGVLLFSTADYWKKLPWGYQPDQTLVVRLDEAGQFEKLRNEALLNPNIVQTGSAANHLGEGTWRTKVFLGDSEKEIIRYDVGAGYFEAMNLNLAQGRFFDERRSTEDALSVIVNQEFLSENKWQTALGQQIRSDGKTCNVVGVVSDFKMMGSAANEPAAFFLAAPADLAYLTLRYEPGTGKQVEAFMKTAWDKLGSGVPFLAFHQSQVFEHFYSTFDNVTHAFGYIAGLALLIACMGLFGLASQNYAARLKESGIRKVLGANANQIILKANRSFIILLLTASLLATGICFGGFRLFIGMAEEFTGKVSLGVFPYLLANLLVFIVAAIAIAWQSFKLARVMPSETLRSE